MKTKISKKKSVIGILALILILTLSLAFVFGQTSASTAYADRGSEENWVTIDEIYDNEAQSFDGTRIMDLIAALTGKRSFSDLENAAKTAVTSATFRNLNSGKNVSVRFGGMKWDAVYLTAAETTEGNTKAGDIILDLWRSADNLASSDAAPYSYYWSNNSTDKDYPSNMYSTSMIRVETLNAGGQYSKIDGSTSNLQKRDQDSGNKYARFTMDDVEGSLTEYIAKPSEVGYQDTEYDSETMKSFYISTAAMGGTMKYYFFPNDAYNTPDKGADDADWDTQDGVQMDAYSSKGTAETAYDAWKNDYLWLPSLTETGMSNGSTSGIGDGMWDTDASLRSANSGVGMGHCWLRSGVYFSAQRAYQLDTSGNYANFVVNNANCGVRPAIHFNLTAAARTAILDKKSWPGDTKTYSPNGVTWEIVNTDMVDVSAVKEGSDTTSWYDTDNHTITATKVGRYELTVKPKDNRTWSDGTGEAITVPYIVAPDEMIVMFNNGSQGQFNNGKLEQRRDVVYSPGMAPIELKLPDPTEKTFPISWKDVAWYSDTISKIEIQYIVKKYTEADHNDRAINSYLYTLKEGQQSDEEWKDYEELTDKTAQEPMIYYTVFFKAEDIEGNHNTHYDYFEIHIAPEELKITLSEAAEAGFAKGVEYGDVAHTKDAFEKDILGGIEKITATAKVVGKPDIVEDRTQEFKDNIDSFTFYLRKDNSMQGGTVQDDGEIYTVEDDGIHLQNSLQKVDNLPLGTYQLYAAVDENISKYITLAWSGDRPSFKVSARKISVTLTFEKGATYGDAHTDWVTATASRATEGAEGSWYAFSDAENEDDFHILNLSYTLQATGAAPDKTTPADAYTVLPTWSNPNYIVEFADAEGGSTLIFIIHKATYDMSGVSFSDLMAPYDGAAHSIEIKGTLPNGVTVAYEGNGQTTVGEYTVTATFKGDAQNYNPIEPMTATLTILSTGNLVTRLEYTFPGSNLPNVIVESADGFDPALKLICDGADNITRTFLAWEKDEISDKYIVKLIKDGEEIPFDGRVTVRLLIPEELRDKDFTFQSVGEAAAVEYTRDGDYIVFEADGLSTYAFTMDGIAYLPILLTAGGISLLGLGTLIVLAIVIKKNKKGE